MKKEEIEQKNFPVSWEEIHRNAKALAWRLVDEGPWKGLIAITRGGLVPACIVARELNIRHIDTLCIASYDYKDHGDSKLLKIPKDAGTGEGWIVIDDLADTGRTFQLARELLPKAHFACIYAKNKGVPEVDSFITEVSQDTWIHFPWDLETRYSTPIVDIKKKDK